MEKPNGIRGRAIRRRLAPLWFACWIVALYGANLSAQREEDKKAQRQNGLDAAEKALDRGNFDAAIRSFRQLTVPPKEWKTIEDTRAHRGLFAAHVGKGDLESALFYAQSIAKNMQKEDNSLLFEWMGNCYREMGHPSAAVDFLRLSNVEIASDRASKLLALTLLEAPVPPLRNGKEASEWLNDLGGDPEKDVQFAKLLSMSYAAMGNFENAVKLQKGLLQSLPPKLQESERQILSLYEKKQVPATSFPRWDRAKIMDRPTLKERAQRSTVVVKVQGLAIDGKTDQESTLVRVVDRVHMGVVLDRMGTILVSSETVDFPLMKEDVYGSPRALRWTKGPVISVETLPDAKGMQREIGKANVLGIDLDSGLALLQIERLDMHEPIADLAPVTFQPEHRWYDPAWEEVATTTYEILAATSSSGAMPSSSRQGNAPPKNGTKPSGGAPWELEERTMIGLQTFSYPLRIEKPQAAGTTSQFVKVDECQATIGSPLFNVLGECIGIVHAIQNKSNPKVVIPSSTCVRIASKLGSFGFVPRATSPMVVSSVSDTKDLPSGRKVILESGMYVSELRSEDPTFKAKNSPFYPIVGEIILSVDGVPTPTTSEWLIAMERIAFAEWDNSALKLEVMDTDKKRRTVSMRFSPPKRPAPFEPAK